MGIMETIMSAVAGAIEKGIGRKNLVAIVAMCLLAAVPDMPLVVCGMIACIAAVAILTQWRLDTVEVWTTGHDQVDNGNGGNHGEGDLGHPDDSAPVDSGAVGTNTVGTGVPETDR